MVSTGRLSAFLRHLALAGLAVVSLKALTAAGVQTPDRPAFDVVSIRPTGPAADDFPFVPPDVIRLAGDQLRATNASALALIHAAYESEYAYRDQIIGADGWIASDRFDVEARAASVLAEAPTFTLPRTAELMLQELLRQRFQLRTRSETREISRLVLTYDRADRSLKPGMRISDRDCSGAKLGADGKCDFRPFPGKLVMRGQPIQTLVDFLSVRAYAGGRVVDGTGITRRVDVDLEWTLDWKDLLASRANLMTALQEQLGLKLENRRLRMPALVIEHIERPSQN
ncbi:MAG: TIGR03435 family protein [Vicinamibacterales bacterium]